MSRTLYATTLHISDADYRDALGGMPLELWLISPDGVLRYVVCRLSQHQPLKEAGLLTAMSAEDGRLINLRSFEEGDKVTVIIDE